MSKQDKELVKFCNQQHQETTSMLHGILVLTLKSSLQ